MEFKSIVKRILQSQETQSQIKNSSSFDEVLNIFRANGYEGNAQELRSILFRNAMPFKELTDDSLMQVAGGISGKKILAACASIMMLTGCLPATNLTNPSSIVVAKASTNNAIIIKDDRYSKLSRNQILRLKELFLLRSTIFISLMDATKKNSDSDKTFNYSISFLKIEFLKNDAEILEILSGSNYAECKNKLDELLSSTDFENFDDNNFDQKSSDIYSDYGLSYDIIDKLGDGSVYGNIDEAYCNLWFKRLAKKKLIKALNKSFDGYKKALLNILSEDEANGLKDYIIDLI